MDLRQGLGSEVREEGGASETGKDSHSPDSPSIRNSESGSEAVPGV